MAPVLAEVIWPLMLALFGVIVGLWLRRWARVSVDPRTPAPRRKEADIRLPGSSPSSARHIDVVTGLSSRAVFVDDLRRRIAEWKRIGTPLSVMLIRIDDFAGIAERRGCRASQTLLAAMSQFLRAMLREMDHVAYYEQDIFVALLPGANLENASKVRQRITESVAGCRLPLEGVPLNLSVTSAIAQVQEGDSVEELLQRVEAALDQAATRRGHSAHLGQESGTSR